MVEMVPSNALATQTEPASPAMVLPPRPTGILSTTRIVFGSIRRTTSSISPVTQTLWAATVTRRGATGSRYTPVTRPLPGSIRHKCGSRSLPTTQTDPSPTATPLNSPAASGPSLAMTPRVTEPPDVTSNRVTVASCVSTTQKPPRSSARLDVPNVGALGNGTSSEALVE